MLTKPLRAPMWLLFVPTQIVWSVFILDFNFSPGLLRGSKTTTESLIKGYGYPIEEYEVETVDDYILALYRIPCSPNNSGGPKPKPVVLLEHGFLESSGDWVLSGSPRSLGFLLADEGYDVWLGNARGTRYSRRNTRLSPSNQTFWRFSWHEIGIYDLPSSIAFIRKKTSVTKIRYIGHSQGTTAFLVAASSVNGFNEYIQSAHFLAPVAFISHATSLPFTLLAPVLGQPNALAATGDFEILPNSRINEIVSGALCRKEPPLNGLCLGFSDLINGMRSGFTNATALRIIFKMSPSGASARQLVHFLQLFNSGKFRQYDYGASLNLKYYQQLEPPDYDLQKVTAPIFMYYSQNDALADPRDVEILAKRLLPATLKRLYKIPFESWNHIDFILGNNVDRILYDIILSDIRSI